MNIHNKEEFNNAIEYFKTQDIFLNGRFGSHNYLNVDGILAQSIELAKYFEPNLNLNEIRRRFQV